VVAVDQGDSLIEMVDLAEPGAAWQDFGQMVLDHLKTAGVQQAHKEDRITFTALTPWPGKLISAEGRYSADERERRAAILVGPEFGIVSRPDLVNAAREAADAGFDVVIACAFNFDARSAELDRIGRIPILKARMNPDLHMADELKNTGAGNLFVVFGEPDIEIEPLGPIGSGSRSRASTCSSRRPARSSWVAPTRSRCGSSTPTTTRKASSSATPISSAPQPTPTKR
jgi:adenine-specific DNA-methyltransferase